MIDANPGLGEAVVSGAVDPDRFVVDAASGTISERRLGDKRLTIHALPGGGTERLEAATPDAGRCLTDEQVRALVALYPVPTDRSPADGSRVAPGLTMADRR